MFTEGQPFLNQISRFCNFCEWQCSCLLFVKFYYLSFLTSVVLILFAVRFDNLFYRLRNTRSKFNAFTLAAQSPARPIVNTNGAKASNKL